LDFSALAFPAHALQTTPEQVCPAQGMQASFGFCGQDYGFRLRAHLNIKRHE
jgi:hypothetical protein